MADLNSIPNVGKSRRVAFRLCVFASLREPSPAEDVAPLSWSSSSKAERRWRSAREAGFTLVEVLMSTALTLIVMGAVVTAFGVIATSINEARATMAMSERLRAAAMRLQLDLAGATANVPPPLAPEAERGYFEIYEGQIGPATRPDQNANNNLDGTTDSTIGDNDDVLMFTTRNTLNPFTGLYPKNAAGRNSTSPVVLSSVAEVAWFVRGRTLYRRVLLVLPQADLSAAPVAGYYNTYDISAHIDPVSGTKMVPNSLGDLTKRENRFAHPTNVYPFDVGRWGQYRLPTLGDCSNSAWRPDGSFGTSKTFPPAFKTGASNTSNNSNTYSTALSATPDYWSNNPVDYDPSDPNANPLVTAGPRQGEDAILSNVIGFDVKVYDPGAPVYQATAGGQTVTLVPGDAGYLLGVFQTGISGQTVVGYGAFVDLGWDPQTKYTPSPGSTTASAAPTPHFQTLGQFVKLGATASSIELRRTYDTFTNHYNRGGTYGGVTFSGIGTNGVDDPDLKTNKTNGIVDDQGEQEALPPYPYPLRAVQVKIRVFDPFSKQVREMTVVQDFLPN